MTALLILFLACLAIMYVGVMVCLVRLYRCFDRMEQVLKKYE